jgi:hypothetical protein
VGRGEVRGEQGVSSQRSPVLSLNGYRTACGSLYNQPAIGGRKAIAFTVHWKMMNKGGVLFF